MSATGTLASRRTGLGRAVRVMLPLAMAVVCAAFAFASPTFRSGANLLHILINDVTLPAIVALGMTLVVSAGGIDLAVGTSADAASLTAALAVSGGLGAFTASAIGLTAAIGVGVLNAALIAGLGITPFLATLGVLFIGESAQQLATNGGAPIYIVSHVPPLLVALAHGRVLGAPVPLIVLGILAAGAHFLMGRTAYGRRALMIGLAPVVARYSGLRTARTLFATYVLSATLSGIAGLLLLATVSSYVPQSGNAFLLDAIGAVFLGTTIHRDARPNVVGSLLGIVLFGVLRNGLLLIGWNFYWQQVAIGLLVLLVLSVSFGARRAQPT